MDIVSQLSRISRYLNMLAQQAPVSSAQLEVLRLVQKHKKNPITLRQLCQIQQVTMPTMSKLVDELQNQSLVIRAHSKDDARQRLIVPTQKGEQQLKQMEQVNQEFWQQKFAHLTTEQQQAIEQALEQLAQAIKPKS